MNHNVVQNLNLIINEVELKSKNVKLLLFQNFSTEIIYPLIDFGHLHFGENKVQEAISKWPDIKDKYKNIKLHLIGKLQTNKVKYVLPLFDYIHSLDNLKLADKINSEQEKFKPKIFIQVNIGNEIQKSGVKRKIRFIY